MPFISRSATPVTVLVDGEPVSYLRAIRCRRTTGGRELDRAEIALDLAAAGQRLVDYEFFRQAVDVEIVATIQGEGDVVLHWGKLAIDNGEIRQGVERLTLTSRAEQFHFGTPVAGQITINPLVSGNLRTVPVDLVFNPEIDGKCWPNLHPEFAPVNGIMSPIFLDPECVRTPTSKELFGVDPSELQVIDPTSGTFESGGADFWTLAEAVLYLCASLNGSELNVGIPTLDELALLNDSPDILRDFRIRRGLFLPQALEELLTPFGYGFFVEYLDVGSRRITVFARGVSVLPSTVTLEPPLSLGGSSGPAPIGDSNAPDIDVEYNRGNCRNFIIVHGGHLHVESTFELYRTWPEDQDDLDPTTDLAKDCDNFLKKPNYRNVWRKWALNESGDYTGLRPEIDETFDFANGAPNLAFTEGPAYATQVPKRRKFLPCITQDQDLAPIGQLQGCMVEFSTDAGETWLPLEQLDNHTCHLLERECGVLFDSQIIPTQLYHAGADARVRITATVRMDDRLVAKASTENSPQTDPAPALVDAGDRFHFRKLGNNSKFLSDVGAGNLPSDQIDDSSAIVDYANHLLSAWNMADVSGRIKIEGLDRQQYELSETIYKVAGREVYLTGSAPSASDLRIPQIVAIDYQLQSGGQYRVLHVETYRETV